MYQSFTDFTLWLRTYRLRFMMLGEYHSTVGIIVEYQKTRHIIENIRVMSVSIYLIFCIFNSEGLNDGIVGYM